MEPNRRWIIAGLGMSHRPKIYVRFFAASLGAYGCGFDLAKLRIVANSWVSDRSAEFAGRSDDRRIPRIDQQAVSALVDGFGRFVDRLLIDSKRRGLRLR